MSPPKGCALARLLARLGAREASDSGEKLRLHALAVDGLRSGWQSGKVARARADVHFRVCANPRAHVHPRVQTHAGMRARTRTRTCTS
eukprot:5070210-Alexandrium_andersonii.AAC.1